MRRPVHALSVLTRIRVAAISAVLLPWCWTLTPTASFAADEATPPALKTRLVSVSLFKNGLGFVTREGELPKGQSVLLLEALPAPAHGTFWVYTQSEDATIKDVVAFHSETVDRVEAT